MTPLEVRQAAEIRSLSETLHARDVRVFQLEHEIQLRTSENKILAEEVALWAEVHQRDRLRVEADQASYAFMVSRLTPAEQNEREGE